MQVTGGGLAPGVAGSAGVGGTRRGGSGFGRLLTLPLWFPAGGLPSLSPANPAAVVPGGGLAFFVARRPRL